MADRTAASTPDGPVERLGFGPQFYPMRIIGTTACILIGWLYVTNFATLRLWYVFLLLLALSYPHLSRWLAGRVERRRAVELGTVLVDAFVVGSTVYVAGFSSIPALSLLTVAAANGMALGSGSLLGASVLCAALGAGIPMTMYGVNYEPREHIGVNLTSALFLLVYFNLFAWLAYRRAVLLQNSRSEMRQQKLAAEIEKERSAGLLGAILPTPIAAELEEHGAVETRRHEHATLLFAEVHDFARVAAATQTTVLLAELNQCFKALDQIALRHRLEPLATARDRYAAVGGLPVPSTTHPTDAVRAALEMRDHMSELDEARGAADRPTFAFRFGVHTGSVVSWVVESRRVSFDVWGPARDVADRIVRAAGPAEVLVSATTFGRAEAGLALRSTQVLRGESGDEIATCHVVEREGGDELGG